MISPIIAVAWLVELGCDPPLWWTGNVLAGLPVSAFSDNPLEALRFARRQDAQLAIRYLVQEGTRDGCKAVEHIHLPLGPVAPASSDSSARHRPRRCPTCDSPQPYLHPSVQHEGEVEVCHDAWHKPLPFNAHTLTLEFHRFLAENEWRAVIAAARAIPQVKHLTASAVRLSLEADG